MRTLRLCVQQVNEQKVDQLERARAARERHHAARREHEREVQEIADRFEVQ